MSKPSRRADASLHQTSPLNVFNRVGLLHPDVVLYPNPGLMCVNVSHMLVHRRDVSHHCVEAAERPVLRVIQHLLATAKCDLLADYHHSTPLLGRYSRSFFSIHTSTSRDCQPVCTARTVFPVHSSTSHVSLRHVPLIRPHLSRLIVASLHTSPPNSFRSSQSCNAQHLERPSSISASALRFTLSEVLS